MKKLISIALITMSMGLSLACFAESVAVNVSEETPLYETHDVVTPEVEWAD